jgi:hypothetical protein
LTSAIVGNEAFSGASGSAASGAEGGGNISAMIFYFINLLLLTSAMVECEACEDCSGARGQSGSAGSGAEEEGNISAMMFYFIRL